MFYNIGSQSHLVRNNRKRYLVKIAQFIDDKGNLSTCSAVHFIRRNGDIGSRIFAGSAKAKQVITQALSNH